MKKNYNIDVQTSRFLDVIRGISAIVVMVFHVILIYILPKVGLRGYLDGVAELLASYAVMAFFVISGFVITISILKNIERNDGQFKLSEFLSSRLVRLYPPLIFSLILTIGVYGLIHNFHLHGSETFRLAGDLFAIREKAILDWDNILWSLLFLQGFFSKEAAPSLNGSLWSLSYELWYYMAAMFFTSWLVNKRQFWGWSLILVIILPMVYLEHIRFFAFLSTWLAGSVWALLYINRQTIEKQFKVLFWPIVVGLTALVIFIVYKNDHLVIANPYTDFLSMITQSLICWLGMLVAMRFILWQERRSLNFFRADQLAKFSYTLYVIHFPLLILGFSFLHPLLHSLNWVYSGITGVLLGLVIILISSRLAAWIENKATIWKYIRRLKSLLGTGKA